MSNLLIKSTLNAIRALFHAHRQRNEITALDAYLKTYLENYTKKDYRVMKQAIDRFQKFLDSCPECVSTISPDLMQGYVEFLKKNSKGYGAYSTYSRFRKAVISAYRHGVIKTNPCESVSCKVREKSFQKDILSEMEIDRLIKVSVPAKYDEIRLAFLFCLYTGMRFCDVKALTNKCIDYSNHLMKFTQAKTGDNSSKGTVYIPLRDDMLNILKKRATYPEAPVFNLPSHPTCNKVLKEWTKAAGINKHITWHCARHSFATILLKNGVDVRVVADLLGHSGLRYVEIYTRALDTRKIQAINSLPSFVLAPGIQQAP